MMASTMTTRNNSLSKPSFSTFKNALHSSGGRRRISLWLMITFHLLLVQNKAFVQHRAPITLPTIRPLSAAPTSQQQAAADHKNKQSPRNDDETESFELKMGRAVDTLNKDYAVLLTERPDFSIFDPNVRCVAPSGSVKLSGLGNYKAAFKILHAVMPLAYTDHQMQHRVVDRSKSSSSVLAAGSKNNTTIRIHWHIQAHPRVIFGGGASVQHTLDGISVYELSPISGNITEHRIERLLWQPPAATAHWYQLFQQTSKKATAAGVAIPNCVKDMILTTTPPSSLSSSPNHVVHFQSFLPGVQRQSRLFSGSGADSVEPSSTAASIDLDALEARNKSRKKFGLKPLSPQEFMDLQQQIQSLTKEQQQRKDAAIALKQQQQQQQQQSSNNWLDKVRGKLDTCESNFDCERPLVCCDFGLIKRCCSSGMMVGPDKRQPRLVPVPADSGYEKRPQRFPPKY